jgi:hypothetical protein
VIGVANGRTESTPVELSQSLPVETIPRLAHGRRSFGVSGFDSRRVVITAIGERGMDVVLTAFYVGDRAAGQISDVGAFAEYVSRIVAMPLVIDTTVDA